MKKNKRELGIIFKGRNKNGITLIALVITIVVLLILAGVSVSMLTGDNGIITQAQKAKEETEYSSWSERIDLAIIETESKYGNPTMDDIINELINDNIILEDDKDNEELRNKGVITTVDGTKIEGKLNDYIKFGPGMVSDKNKEYEDVNGDIATIPAGFSVSIKNDEQIISDGLVVKAPDESEFVWVPVENINTMVQCEKAGGNCNLQLQSNGTLKCITHNSTEIVGKLYAIEDGESFGTLNTNYDANSGLREPAIITGNNDGNEYDAEYYSVAGFNSIDDMLSQLKNEYKIMAQSVAKYKGFYISRYEISFSSATETKEGTTGNIQSKANVMPASAVTDQGNMWYGFYKLEKEYAHTDEMKKSSIGSSMIWGSQYDAMINWANIGKDANKTKENTNGNHSGEKSCTGKYVNDKINNIYDLEGNLFEYTLESHFWGAKVSKGSCFKRGTDFQEGEAQSPSSRYLVNPSWAYRDQGSRMTLYIKE